MVQREAGQFATDLAGPCWVAYIVSYKRMTAARNAARSSDKLRSGDVCLDCLNGRVANVVSRWSLTT